jgi:hypothetical protein
MAKAADPEISAALTTIITELGPALDNLAQRAAAGEPVSR